MGKYAAHSYWFVSGDLQLPGRRRILVFELAFLDELA